MDKKATSIVSYITFIGWIIAYIVGDREEAKFYLNQSLIIVLANLFLSVLSQIFSRGLLSLACSILNFIVFIFWIIGFIHAVKQDDQPIPIIGDITILK